ncbi:Fantastic Four domain [Dillenia turbinata]|uniref:Fantastic Four domain n=1 Tax=Dillenia turbinata TaxID=194707 RepID=A0AAN8VPB5_9MAGN
MAPSVRQGLLSCLEPSLVEPRVLRPILTPPYSNFRPRRTSFSDSDSDSDSEFQETGEKQSNNLSFLQVLDNTTHEPKEAIEKENSFFVHPTIKRSSSILSEKSLKMCTESLGSETGSDTGDDDYFSSNASWEIEDCSQKEKPRKQQCWKSKKMSRNCSFPPPLTTMSSSNGVRVQSHRQGDRLVLDAVNVSSNRTCFEAERGNGRLTLWIWKNYSSNFDEEVADDHDETEENGEETEFEEKLDDEENEALSVDGDEENDGFAEEREESSGNEMGIEKIQRTIGCKENKPLFHWNPSWVATS